MNKTIKTIWTFFGYLYYPIYILSWFLHKAARLVLAVSYYGLLQKNMANDIIKYLFKKNKE